MFNDNVPGWLFNNEPQNLYNLTCIYDRPGAIGVEIGSLHGRSSAIIAQAIPQGILYCIDTWDSYVNQSNWDDQKLAQGGHPLNGALNSFEEFKRNTNGYSNIRAIHGESPNCVSGWKDSIDFLFLDACHHNPSDRNNIDFWLPYIRSGGSLIGHDYDLQLFPDIVENVKYLESLLGVAVVLYDSIWVIKVP